MPSGMTGTDGAVAANRPADSMPVAPIKVDRTAQRSDGNAAATGVRRGTSVVLHNQPLRRSPASRVLNSPAWNSSGKAVARAATMADAPVGAPIIVHLIRAATTGRNGAAMLHADRFARIGALIAGMIGVIIAGPMTTGAGAAMW